MDKSHPQPFWQCSENSATVLACLLMLLYAIELIYPWLGQCFLIRNVVAWVWFTCDKLSFRRRRSSVNQPQQVKFYEGKDMQTYFWQGFIRRSTKDTRNMMEAKHTHAYFTERQGRKKRNCRCLGGAEMAEEAGITEKGVKAKQRVDNVGRGLWWGKILEEGDGEE